MLKAYQVAKLIADTNQVRKIKLVRLDSGEFRYKVKDLSDADYEYFAHSEDNGEIPVEQSKGWVLLDAFTARAVAKVYEVLNDESKAKFDRISMPRLAEFAFKAMR
jgi:hypothetical protein